MNFRVGREVHVSDAGNRIYECKVAKVIIRPGDMPMYVIEIDGARYSSRRSRAGVKFSCRPLEASRRSKPRRTR